MFVWQNDFSGFYAARTSAQSARTVTAFLVSSLRLNWFFLIFSANSMPRIVTAAVSNRLNPSIGRIRCLIRRWSCSTTLFKYWEERIRTRRGRVPTSLSWATARCEAAQPSSVITLGARAVSSHGKRTAWRSLHHAVGSRENQPFDPAYQPRDKGKPIGPLP